jgi:RNA polymerase sigma-32 factor
MKAVKRFDPTMGVRLVSFAVHWIKAEIHEYIIRNWRIVKIATTKPQRKLFFNLRSSKKRLGWMSQEEINDIAKALNVKPSEVVEMEQRLNAHDASFDLPEEDSETESFAPVQYLEAPQSDPAESVSAEDWETHNTQALNHALAKLDPRSQDILQQRWLNQNKATLHELAEKYQVSAERIRQLEANALKQLKQSLELPPTGSD